MHNIYPYHAKFNQSIPRNFILKYSKVGDIVLDPFCGCGTSLLEALNLSRNAVGIDLSPVGILCSKVKTYKYDMDLIKTYANKVLDIQNARPLIPNFPDQNMWFNDDVLDTLGKINRNIQNIKQIEYRDLFFLLLLSILNRCSRRRKTWNLGYLADNVSPNTDNHTDVLALYKAKIKLLYSRKDFVRPDNPYTVKCIESDILDYTMDTQADLLVTSPPYPFAVDFIRYHRLALYWMEKDVDVISTKEAGARNKRNKKDALNEFFSQFEKIYIHIMKMVKVGGHWCMTIGNTTRQKHYIDFVGWSIELFEKHGWVLVSNDIRHLEQQTMAQKRIQTENVLIFKKISE